MIRTMRIGDIELLTISEAARRLERERSTLARQAKKGVLRAIMAGGIYFVDTEELERYRREHLGKHGTASPLHPGTGGRPRNKTP
jgi:excisionase family DNA binding protein